MRDCQELLARYQEIVHSPRNRQNRRYWENTEEPYLVERWRGRSLRMKNAPFTMALDIMGYARILDIDCARYYGDGEEQLYHQLRYAIWEHENLKCHRYFENAVFIGMGSVFEAALFGAKINYLQAAAPWIDEQEHVFENKCDLLKVRPFDFYTSGLCGKVHAFYGIMKKHTAGCDVRVMFPVTLRSPFSTAIMLRGFNALLMDIIDDPGFVRDLVRVITDYLKEYANKRSEFLGEPVPTCYLFNDEVSTPVISNYMYTELFRPSEIELAEFCNGARYWHSCGVSDAFYESVSVLPGLRMMHVGPWSNVKKAVEVFSKKDIALEICLNAVRDVYESSEEQMREKLLSIKSACDGMIRYSVRADGFGIVDTVEKAMQKIKMWNRVALEVFPG
jgi:hypothetical protein